MNELRRKRYAKALDEICNTTRRENKRCAECSISREETGKSCYPPYLSDKELMEVYKIAYGHKTNRT